MLVCFIPEFQGLKMFSDATWAFEKGQVVEPNNKSWAVQLAKVSQLIINQIIKPWALFFSTCVIST